MRQLGLSSTYIHTHGKHLCGKSLLDDSVFTAATTKSCLLALPFRLQQSSSSLHAQRDYQIFPATQGPDSTLYTAVDSCFTLSSDSSPPGNSLIVLAIRVKTKSLWDKKSKLEWLHVLVLLSCSSTKNKFYQWRAESPHYNPDFRGLGQKRSQSRYAPFIVQMWILFCLVFETCLKNAGISKACHHAHHEHVKKHPVPSRSKARSPGIFPKSHGFLWFLILISVWSRNFFPTARES